MNSSVMRNGAAMGMVLAVLVMVGCGEKKPAEPEVLNVEARMAVGLPVAALDRRAITSGIDRAHGTMWVLTGNDVAVKYSAAGMYPVGSELALTRWLERDDPHWFGARIPGTFVSLETVTVKAGADGKPAAEYRRYEGNPGHEVTGAADAGSRRDYVLGLTASEMP